MRKLPQIKPLDYGSLSLSVCEGVYFAILRHIPIMRLSKCVIVQRTIAGQRNVAHFQPTSTQSVVAVLCE